MDGLRRRSATAHFRRLSVAVSARAGQHRVLSFFTAVTSSGLYGNEGILPARWQMRFTGRALLEPLRDSPTLLWLGPHLGLDTQQGMEFICLLGVLLAFGAMVLRPLRDSLLFFCLWALYLSICQVGQVFLYFQW
ncbi:lipase maturation factor 2 [Arapaima gigas]